MLNMMTANYMIYADTRGPRRGVSSSQHVAGDGDCSNFGASHLCESRYLSLLDWTLLRGFQKFSHASKADKQAAVARTLLATSQHETVESRYGSLA